MEDAGTEPLKESATEIDTARAVDRFLVHHRPDMARGQWLYEWHVDRAWPDTDLYAILLDRESDKRVRRGPTGNGVKPRELLRDERFRRAIGINEHDGAAFFNKERFEHALSVLAVPRAGEWRKEAEKAEYRLDLFEKALAAPPPWASTRPARKTRAAPVSEKAAATEKVAAKTPSGTKPTKSARHK